MCPEELEDQLFQGTVQILVFGGGGRGKIDQTHQRHPRGVNFHQVEAAGVLLESAKRIKWCLK